MAVKQIHRSFGYGHQIIKESINAIYNNFGISNIEISAQKYLQSFYESHGFKAFGPDYLEDGIPHIAMLHLQMKGFNEACFYIGHHYLKLLLLPLLFHHE